MALRSVWAKLLSRIAKPFPHFFFVNTNYESFYGVEENEMRHNAL